MYPDRAKFFNTTPCLKINMLVNENGVELGSAEYHNHLAAMNAICRCGSDLHVAPLSLLGVVEHQEDNPMMVCDDHAIHSYWFKNLVVGLQPKGGGYDRSLENERLTMPNKGCMCGLRCVYNGAFKEYYEAEFWTDKWSREPHAIIPDQLLPKNPVGLCDEPRTNSDNSDATCHDMSRYEILDLLKIYNL